MRGFLVGALALVAIQRVVSHPQAYGRVGGVFRVIAEAARRFMDPAVPAFGNPNPRPLDAAGQPTGAAAAAAAAAGNAVKLAYPNPRQLPPLAK